MKLIDMYNIGEHLYGLNVQNLQVSIITFTFLTVIDTICM